MVELVADDTRAFCEKRIVGGGTLDGVAVADGALFHGDAAVENTGHLVVIIFTNELAHEVHESAAFGVDGHIRLRRGLDGGAQGHVGFKLCGENFGEAAADVESVEIGWQAVVQGIDGDEFCSLLCQRFEDNRS